MPLNKVSVIRAHVIHVLTWSSLACAQVLAAGEAPGTKTPTPADPYPLTVAGWGTEIGNGVMTSRWAENWTGMRAAGAAPAFKAIPLGEDASLTLSTEARLRYDTYDNGQLTNGNDYHQGLLRAIVGADLHFNSNVRVYSEIGTGQVDGRRDTAAANFKNDASLQQLFVDAREYIGSALVGAMAGRQEFADAPRQLVSVSDGPNIHRTWNGARFYAHAQNFRVGAFELRVTRQGRAAFDEEINPSESLRGLNASMVLATGNGRDAFLDPFWLHTENASFRSGGHTGLDERDTVGMRLSGRQGDFRFDWTLAHQSGNYINRDIGAWGLFAVDSLTLSNTGWKPRLTSHIDIASGGGAYGSGKLTQFNQLYASSNYLGEAQFLSLSNLLLIAPGISVSPTATTTLSLEYGFARRLNENDAAYAGGMRAYVGTQNVKGHEIGGLLRLSGTMTINAQLNLFCNYEHLAAGDVLKRAQLPSGSYGYVGATFRY